MEDFCELFELAKLFELDELFELPLQVFRVCEACTALKSSQGFTAFASEHVGHCIAPTVALNPRVVRVALDCV